MTTMGAAVDSLCSIMETFIAMIIEKSVVLFYMLINWQPRYISGNYIHLKLCLIHAIYKFQSVKISQLMILNLDD